MDVRQEKLIAIIILKVGAEMRNLDIRENAKKKNVKLWQIAEKLGYAHDTAFSKALRHELTEEKKTEIFKIIDELAAE